jgi:hypothetical protein
VRKLPVDHDKRAADLLELVQLTGLGDRWAAAAAVATAAPVFSTKFETSSS